MTAPHSPTCQPFSLQSQVASSERASFHPLYPGYGSLFNSPITSEVFIHNRLYFVAVTKRSFITVCDPHPPRVLQDPGTVPGTYEVITSFYECLIGLRKWSRWVQVTQDSSVSGYDTSQASTRPWVQWQQKEGLGMGTVEGIKIPCFLSWQVIKRV